MSAEALYQVLGLKGYSVDEIRLQAGELVVAISQPRESLRCPCCGTARVIAQGHQTRLFRTVPLGSQPVWIAFDVPRVRCYDCGIVRQVRVRFAAGKPRYTKAFERYALELARITTTKDAAIHLGISWDTMRGIERRYLEKTFAKPKLKNLKRIAYGYRNQEYFKLKILALHRTQYALVG